MTIFEVLDDKQIYTYELDTDDVREAARFHTNKMHPNCQDHNRVTIGVRTRSEWRWETFVVWNGCPIRGVSEMHVVSLSMPALEDLDNAEDEKESKVDQLKQWIMDLVPYGQYDKYVQVIKDTYSL